MESTLWRAEMALGIPLFDEAHQALAEQLAVLQATPDAEFEAGLAELVGRYPDRFPVQCDGRRPPGLHRWQGR